MAHHDVAYIKKYCYFLYNGVSGELDMTESLLSKILPPNAIVFCPKGG